MKLTGLQLSQLFKQVSACYMIKSNNKFGYAIMKNFKILQKFFTEKQNEHVPKEFLEKQAKYREEEEEIIKTNSLLEHEEILDAEKKNEEKEQIIEKYQKLLGEKIDKLKEKHKELFEEEQKINDKWNETVFDIELYLISFENLPVDKMDAMMLENLEPIIIEYEMEKK